MANSSTLKAYFESGDTPTEAQFGELIDTIGNTDSLNTGSSSSVVAAVNDVLATAQGIRADLGNFEAVSGYTTITSWLSNLSLSSGLVVGEVQSNATIGQTSESNTTCTGSASANTVTVADNTNIVAGKLCHIVLDDGSTLVTKVRIVSGTTITISDQLPSAVTGGAFDTYRASLTLDTGEADAFTVGAYVFYTRTTGAMGYGTVISASGTALVVSTGDSAGVVASKTNVGGVSDSEFTASKSVNSSLWLPLSSALSYGLGTEYYPQAYDSGGTVDATSINAAIDAANTAGGGVVVLPVGSFEITSSIVLKNNVSLIGQGQGATTITFNPTDSTLDAAAIMTRGVYTTPNKGKIGGFTLVLHTSTNGDAQACGMDFRGGINQYTFQDIVVSMRNGTLAGIAIRGQDFFTSTTGSGSAASASLTVASGADFADGDWVFIELDGGGYQATTISAGGGTASWTLGDVLEDDVTSGNVHTDAITTGTGTAGSSSLTVADGTNFNNSDTVDIQLDDGSFQKTTISSGGGTTSWTLAANLETSATSGIVYKMGTAHNSQYNNLFLNVRTEHVSWSAANEYQYGFMFHGPILNSGVNGNRILDSTINRSKVGVYVTGNGNMINATFNEGVTASVLFDSSVPLTNGNTIVGGYFDGGVGRAKTNSSHQLSFSSNRITDADSGFGDFDASDYKMIEISGSSSNDGSYWITGVDASGGYVDVAQTLTSETPYTAITAATAANPCVITSADYTFIDGNTVKITGVVGNMGDDVLNGNTFVVNTIDGTITGATKANPCKVTITSHPFSNGDDIVISGVKGMMELNGNTYTVANATANDFELSGVDSSSYQAYSSGGSARHADKFELVGTDTTGKTYTSGGTVGKVLKAYGGAWHVLLANTEDDTFVSAGGTGPFAKYVYDSTSSLTGDVYLTSSETMRWGALITGVARYPAYEAYEYIRLANAATIKVADSSGSTVDVLSMDGSDHLVMRAHTDKNMIIDTGAYNGDWYVKDADKGSVENVIWYDFNTGIVYLGNTGYADPEVIVRGSLQVNEALTVNAGDLSVTGNVSMTGGLGQLNLQASTELTISSGAVTATKSYHTIDTEGGSVGITGVTDAGGGEIEVTTDAVHGLAINDKVTISGTTDYNGEFTVNAVPTTTTYQVTDTYVSSQTGTSVHTEDTLATISGGTEGDILVIRPQAASRTVLVVGTGGNIDIATTGTFTMDNDADAMTLIYDGASWLELSRSNNAT